MKSTNLINLAATKPLKIIIFFAALFILATVALFKIPIELMPNIDSNTISVTTRIKGGMPADQTEQIITIPLEQEFSVLSGVKNIHSVSKDSESTIIINFTPNTNTDTAVLEINQIYEKIKPTLPKEIKAPTIAKYNQYDAPLFIVSLYSDNKTAQDLRDLTEKQIKQRFLKIKGIANVEIAGGREKKIVISLSEKKLIKRGLSIDDITRSINTNNSNILAGNLNKNKTSFSVRTDALYKNLDEISDLIISAENQTDIIKLKDVAEIKYDYAEAVDIARINGKESVCIYLQKQSDANTLSVCTKARKAFKEIKALYASDLKMEIVSDKSEFIKKSLSSLLGSLFTGIFLAFFIILLFLKDKRTTAIVCLSIPLSLVFSIAALYFFGHTLNINSISGLALGVGMLVDSAIVISENIFKNFSQTRDFKKAIIKGTRQLVMPLIASTATTIIVFIPMLAANAQTKQLYAPMALAVTFSLLFSLAISLLLIPALTKKYGHQTACTKETSKNQIKLKRTYKHLLIKTGRKQKTFAYVLLGLFLLSIIFIYKTPKNISPYAKENRFTVFVELKSGARLDIADKAVKEAESILKSVPEIKQTIVRIEQWSGKIYVTLKDNISSDTKEIMKKCESLLKDTGKKQNAFIYLSSSQENNTDELTLNIYGYDYPTMLKCANLIHSTIEKDKNFFNFKYRYKPGRPEKVIEVNTQKALLAGFTTKDIADKLHAKIRGVIASEIFEQGKENEIIVRIKETDRYTMDDIINLHLVNNDNKRIPLKNISKIKTNFPPSQIWHLNKKRLIQIQFSYSGHTLTQAAKQVSSYVDKINLPKKCFYEFDTNYLELKKSYNGLKLALLFMILFVYMVLASVFEDYSEPLKIMLTLPFAVLGIAVSVMFTKMQFSLGSLSGVMILGGICVNNAIIMTDCFNQFKKKYKNTITAAIYAACDRLRPITMTTLTTIIGLVPLMFKTAKSTALYKDMATTVVFGLSFSTVIILFVFPYILAFKKK